MQAHDTYLRAATGQRAIEGPVVKLGRNSLHIGHEAKACPHDGGYQTVSACYVVNEPSKQMRNHLDAESHGQCSPQTLIKKRTILNDEVHR